MRWLLLIALAACRAPDYYEVSAGHSEGEITRGLGLDTEQNVLGFSIGWFSGQTAEAVRAVSMLDVSRAGELTLREEAAATEVHVASSSKTTDSPVDKILLAVAGLVVALTGILAVVVRQLKKGDKA